MRILVIDDSATLRARLTRLLRDIEGVELVVEAEDTVKADHLSRVMSPHLIFLDLGGQNGLEVLPVFKGRPPSPKVVVLTNHPGEAYAARCRELGADHFFDKSSQFQQAIDVVRSDLSEPHPFG
jgi:two-component system, OmpR family, response regulator